MSQFQEQLQQGIARWLEAGKKSGSVTSDSDTVILSSILGNRSENQDRAIFLRVKFDGTNKPSIAALVLCDGMGGMVSGGDCANLAISTFSTSLVRSNAPILIDRLVEAASSANQAVYESFQGRGGATLSAIVCNDAGEWTGINVGDSRIYGVLNDGTVQQLTVDDTLENQLADLKLPSPPPEFRQLLQYIGMGDGIEPRKIDFQSSVEIKWFLVTSDGAHSIPKDIFKSLVNHAKGPEEIVYRLTELSEWLGGRDNATAAVLTVGEELFLRNKKSSPSSLEVWGVPGKVEFLSIKSLRADPSQNGVLPSNKVAETSVRSTAKPNELPNPNKESEQNSTKKKRKSVSKKIDSEEVKGGSEQSNNRKERLKKPQPLLDIEFSAEEG